MAKISFLGEAFSLEEVLQQRIPPAPILNQFLLTTLQIANRQIMQLSVPLSVLLGQDVRGTAFKPNFTAYIPTAYLSEYKFPSTLWDSIGAVLNLDMEPEKWVQSMSLWQSAGAKNGEFADAFVPPSVDSLINTRFVSYIFPEEAREFMIWNFLLEPPKDHNPSNLPRIYFELMNFAASRDPKRFKAEGLQRVGQIYPKDLDDYCSEFKLPEKIKASLGEVLKGIYSQN